MKVAEAFQIVDTGTPFRAKGSTSSPKRPPNNSNATDNIRTGPTTTTRSSRRNFAGKPLPSCPNPPCSQRQECHWIDDCEKFTTEEKVKLKSELRGNFAAKKAADGPQRNKRSKEARNERQNSETVGRIMPTATGVTPNCSVKVSDGTTFINSTCRCDDGSDDSIGSPKLAEAGAIKGTRKISAIPKVTLAVALKKETEDKAEHFSFLRTRTLPRTVLHLASGNLGLFNISSLVADDDLACEALMIGRQVLQHLRVDTNILLDTNKSALNGADCSDVGNPTSMVTGGYVTRIMVARFNGEISPSPQPLSKRPLAARPRVVYDAARREDNPFPDSCLLNSIDSD